MIKFRTFFFHITNELLLYILISKHIEKKIDEKYYDIVHTENFVKSTDSPLEAAKRGKDTSMWLSIESVKKKNLT